MGEGDFMPAGGHSKKVIPGHAQKIIAGGQKAQQIAAVAEKYKREVEAPVADAQLAEDLEKLEEES